jgi:uncharacterized metal-binding protein YceD (DUF177 family)
MMMIPTEHLWRVPVRTEDVPPEGTRVHLSADDQTRKAIATLAGLRALPRLEATFEVTAHNRGGLRVTGDVSATVGQTCVVTLEPVENEIRETVDLVFVPGAVTLGSSEVEDIVPGAEELPESLVDGTVDLGALAIEFLILGIDPYPRKPGAVFEDVSVGEAPSHPFAALAKLKEKRNRGSE